MTVFGNYSYYYDLLYREKDYVGEAQFVHQLIQQYAPGSQSILDLGCGTGNHAKLLVKEGYQVHGVDLSTEMLQQAHNHYSHLPIDMQTRLHFSEGDIRQVKLNQTFDVVLALFHVISYQTTNDDILAAFQTVKQHLKPNGIFIFDIWYGPAVLTERPSVRVKRLEDECIQVTRIAEPEMNTSDSCVNVNYQVFIKEKDNGIVQELSEIHQMRYLFKPEIELMLRQYNLKLIECREWLTKNTPDINTWGVYFIVQG